MAEVKIAFDGIVILGSPLFGREDRRLALAAKALYSKFRSCTIFTAAPPDLRDEVSAAAAPVTVDPDGKQMMHRLESWSSEEPFGLRRVLVCVGHAADDQIVYSEKLRLTKEFFLKVANKPSTFVIIESCGAAVRAVLSDGVLQTPSAPAHHSPPFAKIHANVVLDTSIEKFIHNIGQDVHSQISLFMTSQIPRSEMPLIQNPFAETPPAPTAGTSGGTSSLSAPAYSHAKLIRSVQMPSPSTYGQRLQCVCDTLMTQMTGPERDAFKAARAANYYLLVEYKIDQTDCSQAKYERNHLLFESLEQTTQERELSRFTENAVHLADWIKVIVAAGGAIPHNPKSVSLPDDPAMLRSIVNACPRLRTTFLYALALAANCNVPLQRLATEAEEMCMNMTTWPTFEFAKSDKR